MVMAFFYSKAWFMFKFMFAFYALFSTLAAQSHYPCDLLVLKKSSLLASAPVVGVTIKSEYYRALLVSFLNFPTHKIFRIALFSLLCSTKLYPYNYNILNARDFCLTQLRGAKIQLLNLGNMIICPQQHSILFFQQRRLVRMESFAG